TDASGAAALENGWTGVYIAEGAHHNRIGGPQRGERNVISGNHSYGVAFASLNTNNNALLGNYIGVDVTGAVALSNGYFGVALWEGASNNRIGGPNVGERNIVSGNRAAGIALFDPNTSGNLVQGNYVGTDLTGTEAIPNSWEGIGLRN